VRARCRSSPTRSSSSVPKCCRCSTTMKNKGSSQMLLDGKVAIVSGIGPGMGRDLSLAFAREGADVALAGRTQDKLDAVADEVTALGRRAHTVVCDVSDEAGCVAAATSTAEALGGVDIL